MRLSGKTLLAMWLNFTLLIFCPNEILAQHRLGAGFSGVSYSFSGIDNHRGFNIIYQYKIPLGKSERWTALPTAGFHHFMEDTRREFSPSISHTFQLNGLINFEWLKWGWLSLGTYAGPALFYNYRFMSGDVIRAPIRSNDLILGLNAGANINLKFNGNYALIIMPFNINLADEGFRLVHFSVLFQL